MVRRAVFAFALSVAINAAARAQDVQTDPLQCWWRTSAGAIRVGEPFTVVLTCAVLETDAATVVVDQSRLEPSVVQFAPFEVLGGSHGADLRTDQRRFFQYEYRLRLIAENLFGKDVALPETKLSYRVQSKVGQKTSIQGRDQAYVLPAESIRVMSLVPADASDIRDAPAETFGDIDQRAFRANLFSVIGTVLFVLAGLLALLAVVRLARRYQKPSAAGDRLITDAAVLRGISRELSAVQRERDRGGWTPELAGRALAALRIAATYAVGRRASLMPAKPLGVDPNPNSQSQSATVNPQSATGNPHSAILNPQSSNLNPQSVEPGRLILQAGWPRGKRIAVSGSVTPQTVARELSRAKGSARRTELLESLAQALTAFTTAHFGRDGTLDDGALDQALATAKQVLRRMKIEQIWFMKRLAARRAGTKLDSRAWSR